MTRHLTIVRSRRTVATMKLLLGWLIGIGAPVTVAAVVVMLTPSPVPATATLPAASTVAATASASAAWQLADTAVAAPPTSTAPIAVEPDGLSKLAAYTLDALTAWKKPGKDAVSYEAVATDIAQVCLASEPLWTSDPHRVRCAILLASLAYHEGALLAYVDDGRVNSGRWREDAWRRGITWSPNISDNGEAYSLWQIHTEKGIILTPDGEWRHSEGAVTDAQGSRKPGVIIGPDLTKNRKLAVKVALAFVRKSLRVTHSLVGYTGETRETGYNKARQRELFAANWVKRHPFER